MFSLANARSAEELRAWVQRMRNHLAREGIEDAAVPLRLRAEDRRPRDVADLPRRRARARRDARQRRGRRGRHAQPAHDRRDPAADRGRAAARRGARRGLHDARRLRRAERAPRRRGRVDVHEPAQLGGRHDPPARPEARPPSARCRSGPTASAPPTGLTLGSQWETLELAARARLPRQPRHRAPRQRGRGRRALPGLAAAPRRAGLRDRRRRREGRRRGAAAAPGRRRARPALGDRVEVPADDEDHDAARHPVEPRQVRRPAPVRRARAGPRRRRDREARDAAQRGGPRAQGPARRRRGDRAARRRRDPAGRLAGAARRRAQGPRRAAAAAGALPGLRHADGQARGPRLHEVPEPRLPGPPLAAAASTSSRAGRWTSTGSARSRSRC